MAGGIRTTRDFHEADKVHDLMAEIVAEAERCVWEGAIRRMSAEVDELLFEAFTTPATAPPAGAWRWPQYYGFAGVR